MMCLVTHRSLHGVTNSQACDADVAVTILRCMLSVVDWTPLCFLVDLCCVVISVIGLYMCMHISSTCMFHPSASVLVISACGHDLQREISVF